MKFSTQTIARLMTLDSLLAVAILLVLITSPVQAESRFELVTHPADVYGANDVANGEIEKGIQRLNKMLGSDRQAHSVRVPILIDLCVAYTMLKDFDAATEACDAAVETGWFAGLAYNNRGVLNVAKGDYQAAQSDFESAISKRGADKLARRNLDRTIERVARQQQAENYVAEVSERR